MQVAHGGSWNVAKITRKTAGLKKRSTIARLNLGAAVSNITEVLLNYFSRDGRSIAFSLRFPVYLVVVEVSSISSRLDLSESHEAELYSPLPIAPMPSAGAVNGRSLVSRYLQSQ